MAFLSYSIRKNETASAIMINVSPFILLNVTFFVFFLVVAIWIKISPMGRYHAAEHMAAHALAKGVDLSVAVVMKQNRVHPSCGTNLVIFIMLFLYICQFFLPIWLSILVSLSFGYEVFRARNIDGKIGLVMRPFYALGGLCQHYLFTSCPSEREVNLAITALEKLREVRDV